VTEPESAYIPGDVVVERVNALTTTFLDLLGTLLLTLAAGWAVWGAPWRHALAAAVAGLIVMVLSSAAQFRARPAPVKHAASGGRLLPGPSDAGTIHIAGGR
jgi:hypothetical protein